MDAQEVQTLQEATAMFRSLSPEQKAALMQRLETENELFDIFNTPGAIQPPETVRQVLLRVLGSEDTQLNGILASMAVSNYSITAQQAARIYGVIHDAMAAMGVPVPPGAADALLPYWPGEMPNEWLDRYSPEARRKYNTALLIAYGGQAHELPPPEDAAPPRPATLQRLAGLRQLLPSRRSGPWWRFGRGGKRKTRRGKKAKRSRKSTAKCRS